MLNSEETKSFLIQAKQKIIWGKLWLLVIASYTSSVLALMVFWFYLTINIFNTYYRDGTATLIFLTISIICWVLFSIPSILLIIRNWKVAIGSVIPFIIIALFFVNSAIYFLWPSRDTWSLIQPYIAVTRAIFFNVTGRVLPYTSTFSDRSLLGPSIPIIPDNDLRVISFKRHYNKKYGFEFALPGDYIFQSAKEASVSEGVMTFVKSNSEQKIYPIIIYVASVQPDGLYAPYEGLYGYDLKGHTCWGVEWAITPPIAARTVPNAQGCAFGTGGNSLFPFDGYLIPHPDGKSIVEVIISHEASDYERNILRNIVETFQFNPIYDSEKNEVSTKDGRSFISSWKDVLIKTDIQCPSYNLISNTNSKIDDNDEVFVRPWGGEIYKYGDELIITWRPEKIDVSTISIVSSDNLYNRCFELGGWANIYRREQLSDEVSTNRYFVYRIPTRSDLNFVYPGEYRIKLSTYGEKLSILSKPFEIAPNKPFLHPIPGGFGLKIIGEPKIRHYNQDSTLTIQVSVLAQSNVTGESISITDGFAASAKLYKKNLISGSSGDYIGIIYGVNTELATGMWDFNGVIKNLSEGSYRIDISFWCGNVFASCSELFSPNQNHASYSIIFDLRNDEI